MTIHWIIKMLNAVFVLSLGMTILWLIIQTLSYNSSRSKRHEDMARIFLLITNNGASYLKMFLNEGKYLIGRDHSCNIVLKGIGVPSIVGELFVRRGVCQFKYFHGARVINQYLKQEEKIMILKPGQWITLYGYILNIEIMREKEM